MIFAAPWGGSLFDHKLAPTAVLGLGSEDLFVSEIRILRYRVCSLFWSGSARITVDAVRGARQRPDAGRETPRSAAQTLAVLSIQHTWHNVAMARKSREYDSTNGGASGRCDEDTSAGPIDLRVFGLSKAAYGVSEALDLLSIGRTSLYAAVKRGDLKRVKFGKKTLFYAADLASFLTRLRRLSEADAHRAGHAPGASKSTEQS
jgi:excisionase family DNA binding protein